MQDTHSLAHPRLLIDERATSPAHVLDRQELPAQRASAEHGETTPTVFVVDDDEAARESVCALVAAMDVNVEAFESAMEFLASYDTSRTGCLVTDVRMAGIGGLELQKRLRQANVRLPVVVVSAYIDVRGTVTAMQDGAVTVLTKPYEEQRLWEAIQHGLNLSQAWCEEDRRNTEVLRRLDELTAVESEVVDLVIDGLPNKAVAKRLGISIRTVEDRRARIMTKLKVHSFASLLRLVHEARAIKERNLRQRG